MQAAVDRPWGKPGLEAVAATIDLIKAIRRSWHDLAPGPFGRSAPRTTITTRDRRATEPFDA